MHDIKYLHCHELEEGDFSGCCKDCNASLNIIKPHIMAFAKQIQNYTKGMLAALKPGDLYRLYQILDDLAHMDSGIHLPELILKDTDISGVLPVIRSYYTIFFSIHEVHLANELLVSNAPWETIKTFPLYPRYETLVKNQMEELFDSKESKLLFIGCGPVPISLILMTRLYGIRSIGLDSSKETVELSKKVIRCLDLEKKVEIIHGDDSHIKKLDWNMVLVAALAEPKARIFQNLCNVLKERRHATVVFRTYTGMRTVLYKPVQSSDIKGFRIVKEILPTGRVNNTIVFAELEE